MELSGGPGWAGTQCYLSGSLTHSSSVFILNLSNLNMRQWTCVILLTQS